MILLKAIHVLAVMGSFSFFILRFYWMLVESKLLKAKIVRILPHVVDTILLASAIGLAIQLQQYPFVDNWLTAKVLALILYIVLGTYAIKRGSTKKIRIVTGVSAILVFLFIVSVATSKTILGFG